MGILIFFGTLFALHIIGIVMVFFLPDYPGFSGLDHLAFVGVMLLWGGSVYCILMMITGGSLLISIVYLIFLYLFVFITRASSGKGLAEEKMTVYISGAVTGKPNNNKRAFQAAYNMIGQFKGRPHLRDMKIISPPRIAARLEKTFAACGREPIWEDYMRACIKKLCEATCVYFLPDWVESRGATIERYLAKRLNIACADNRDELQKIIGVYHENQFNG